jgi:hypothetical protein
LLGVSEGKRQVSKKVRNESLQYFEKDKFREGIGGNTYGNCDKSGICAMFWY